MNVRPACVPDFALRIGQRATLLRVPEARVHGILMELTHAEIEQLYSEPSVRAYRPEAVLAELTDGSRVPALCFNLPVPPGPEEVNSDYATKLRDLARRLGLPSVLRRGSIPRGPGLDHRILHLHFHPTPGRENATRTALARKSDT